MQEINKNNLFSIFEQGDEEILVEAGHRDQLENPFVLLGMVVSGLSNYGLMDIMYMRQHPEEYKNVRATVKYKYFNKLYRYLCKIDTDKFDPKYKVGEDYNFSDSFLALDGLRGYYESIEQYEKCAIVKSYQDHIADQTLLPLEVARLIR